MRRDLKNQASPRVVDHQGLTFAALTEGTRKAQAAFLAQRLLEGPPDLLTTSLPSRVRVPHKLTHNKTERKNPLRFVIGGSSGTRTLGTLIKSETPKPLKYQRFRALTSLKFPLFFLQIVPNNIVKKHIIRCRLRVIQTEKRRNNGRRKHY